MKQVFITVKSFQGPGGHVDREDYLLGRKIDTAFEQLVTAEKEEEAKADPQKPTFKPAPYQIEHGT